MEGKAVILIRIPKTLKEKIESSAKAKGYRTLKRYIEVEKKAS